MATTPNLGWPTRPLVECGRLLSGGTPSKSRPEYWDGEIPWFSSKELRALELTDSELHVSAEGAKSGSNLVPTGSVLFVVRGMSLANEFRVSLTLVDSTFNQDVKAVVPAPDVDPRYLARCLRWLEPRVLASTEESSHGTKRLSAQVFENLPIPVPPLEDQWRIAEILDKVDAIRRKREETISLSDELLRSAFLEMFGDPVTNRKQWNVVPLGETIDRLEAGWSANGEARERRGDEYGVLKISAVTSGFFRRSEHKAVARSAIGRHLVTPRAGDLLFSRANTRELVAATCLVEQDEPQLFLPDKIWRVIPKIGIASTPYLRFLLAHDRFRGELTKTATGTSGSMLNVSMEKLRALRAPIPPIATQDQFAQLVWKSLKTKSLQERARDVSNELFSSLVQRAFRGELHDTSGGGDTQLTLFGGEGP